MKKLFIIQMIGMIMLTGCGGGTSGGSSQNSDSKGGGVHETDVMSVTVPKGWKAISYLSYNSETEKSEVVHGTVAVHKGAKTDYDQMSTPGIRVMYRESFPEWMHPESSIYQNVVKMEPFTLGNYKWNGFSGDSPGYGSGNTFHTAMLWATGAKGDGFEIHIFLEMEGKKISLEDADVKEIISSITLK